MKQSSLLRVLCVLVTSVVLICTPESSFAAGGHGGGGGGFHGGGGGFHGGGFGGYHGGWGGAGWHGGYGWHGGWGGYGSRGWGYPGWGRGWGWGYPGWGWGVGVGFGWGWGSYWASYPYAYSYPYYYPYYPYYPYDGPDAYVPADPGRYSGGNSQQQNSRYLGPERSTGVNDKIQTMTFVNHKTAGDAGFANYWLSNDQQRTVPRQEVRNVMQALLAMPPEARRRQIESGRYRNFSPEEQELLNQVAQVSPREPQKNADGTKPVALRLTSR